LTKESDESSIMFTNALKEINRINTKIDSMRKLYYVDLAEEYSKLVRILSRLINKHMKYHARVTPRRYISSIKLELVEAHLLEFEVSNKVLQKLTEKLSEYANELEQSLIDTGELRKAINEAKRQQAKTSVMPGTDKTINAGIEILDNEIEKLSIANSNMKAKEPGEKRKIAFKLVTLFIALLPCFIVPYFTYMTVYLHADPLASNYLSYLAVLYVMSCIGIYVAIGAIAKIKQRKET